MLKRVNRERGIGLLELMLSLSIIAILLIMAVRYFMVANESQKINNAISEINGIAGGAANYGVSYPGYLNISMTALIQGRFIPSSLGGADGLTGKGANPWGGDLDINTNPVTGSGKGFEVVMSGLPIDASAGTYTVCEKLKNAVDTSVKGKAICDGNTVRVDFN